MSRQAGWILAVALLVAACGSGEPQPEAEEAAAAAAKPVARPAPPPSTAAAPAPSPDAAAANAPAPAVTEATLPAGRLYTVQVAALAYADSARVWRERLEQRGLPVWTVQAVVDGRTVHRLRVGAHPSLSSARELGRRITREYRWPVWVAPVEQRAAVPADAVAATRALLTGA